MGYNKYYGTLWIVFEGKNPKFDDDVLSIKLENIIKTENDFQFLSIRLKTKNLCFRLVIFSLGISIFTQ